MAAVGVGAVAFAAPSLASAAGVWSNPTYGRITSTFRPPSRPYHAGYDIANPQGTAIWAANAGKVVGVRTGSYPGDMREGLLPGRTGNAVLIDHQNGYRSYYGHLVSSSVSVGQTVSAGQLIAAMGTTGNSTGPHLHFEIASGGTPINPYTFLSGKGIVLGSSKPVGGGGGGWPSVKQGQKNERVRVVQHLLNAHGYTCPADADFGPNTVAKVKAFQKAKGLVVDGWIGTNAWPRLILDVKKGASGSRAKAAQVGLNRHGAKLLVDGDFGTNSVNATKNFQRSKGLAADGWVGPNTWRLVVA